MYLHIHYMQTDFWYGSFIFVLRDYYFVQRKICLEGSMSSKQNIGFQVYIHPKGCPTNLTPFSQGACLVKAVKGSHLPLEYFSTCLYKDTIINTMWLSLLGGGKSNTTQTLYSDVGQFPVMVKLTTWKALQEARGMSPGKSQAVAIVSC